MRAALALRTQTKDALQRAISSGELVLHYQPIVALDTARPAGVEALVRWRHPAHGLVLPDDFIGLAEETGLIVPLGRWALAEACRAASTWPARGGVEPAVSVNLSPRECRQNGLVELVGRTLRETGLPPSRLRLEVTERALIEDMGAAHETLQRVRDLGVGVAIDDFGTGYSSLGYLRRLPVDALKIDRSFVAGLGEEAPDRAVVEAVTALAHALGKSVTAEGVETPVQLEHVRAAGCDRAQGYFIAEPLPPEAIASLLA
jgi:EAL domain-containing protein (putative c-di-GMP-specific phosphodiesterase class I)